METFAANGPEPRPHRIATSIHYKDTGSHSYLNFSSSHPYSCKSSYLIVSFSDCVISAVMMMTLTSRQQKWRPSLQHAGIRMTLLQGEENRHWPNQGLKSRVKSQAANNNANDRVPFVTTFHLRNLVAGKIISRNFRILREDSTYLLTSPKPIIHQRTWRWLYWRQA